jgi:hypothetical protein
LRVGTGSPTFSSTGRHPRAKTITRSGVSAQIPDVDPIWKPWPHQFCGHPATTSYGPVMSPPPFCGAWANPPTATSAIAAAAAAALIRFMTVPLS